MRSPDPPPSTPPRSMPRTGPSCASMAPTVAPSCGASTSPSSTRCRRPSSSEPPPSPILLRAISPSLSPSRSTPQPPWTSRRPSQSCSPCPSLRPSPSRPRASTLSPMLPCTLSSAMAPSGGGGRRAAIHRRRGPAGRARGPRRRSACYSTRSATPPPPSPSPFPSQIFENINILHQLRYGGVLEAIRISCASYPTKRTFDEFIIDRFGMLAPELVDSSDEKAACAAIRDRMGLKGYQVPGSE
uniref:Myosin motor domain-containing protein n=1 Tax=Setaria viridis TaxID=4556 RepID=A0A4U6W8R1_SETVI|nr:hypothetical protein SEVIR_1G144300v2 [Setaria viridis]